MLAFITYGMTMLVCVPPKKAIYRMKMLLEANTEKNRWFVIHGRIYNLPDIYKPYQHKGGLNPYKMFATMDISPYFDVASAACSALAQFGGGKALACRMPGTNAPAHCHQADLVRDLEYLADLALDWADVESPALESNGPTRFVYNGQVYDVGAYLAQVGAGSSGKPYGQAADRILRRILGGDGTRALSTLPKEVVDCITARHRAGYLEVKSIGCIATDIVLYVSLVVILTVVLTKFFLAIGFAFSMARRLGKIPRRNQQRPPPPPTGDVNPNALHASTGSLTRSPNHAASGRSPLRSSRFSMAQQRLPPPQGRSALHLQPQTYQQPQTMLLDSTNSADHMYAILLVTCYSEDEVGIRTTLDSLASTDYDDKQKLLFIVADGIITGSGNSRSTPEILVSMLEPAAEGTDAPAAWAGSELFEPYYFDAEGKPERLSYVAIADGEKRHNMARVYAGFYRCRSPADAKEARKLHLKRERAVKERDAKVKQLERERKRLGQRRRGPQTDEELSAAQPLAADVPPIDERALEEGIEMVDHRVPTIVVVKCGTPAEAHRPKPGNRGKRDSQIVLMSFLSKCLFDDRMTPLEFDLFYKITRLTGVTPDHYEVLLMVDADTKVLPDALMSLVLAMRSDEQIMGLCGETRIQNKAQSWVTAIQVFEYYISHHLNKAFESIFGGVTCLPGCFCMYRIKAPKGNYWVPIVASADIVDAYSENVTDTLHKKNLLLLGEDRYLTTLMLKTFPKRKLLFVPQAVCKTFVPETFSVLLSQRRRWINSTIHNLFELALVPDLCGIFCCSMQFVIFMELAGTLVLPAAITFTGVLIVSTFVTTPQWIPLVLLAAILGLPAVLILFTTAKPTYVLWFLVYIFSLPIWNFVLPVYAFWHFDDFSWGETRKLDGPTGGAKDDHGNAHGRFDSSQIYMKRWIEFEAERRTKVERYLSAMHGIIPHKHSSAGNAGGGLGLHTGGDSGGSLHQQPLASTGAKAASMSLEELTRAFRPPAADPRTQH